MEVDWFGVSIFFAALLENFLTHVHTVIGTFISLINKKSCLLFFQDFAPILANIPPPSFIDSLDFSTLLVYSSYIVMY
jgi:hypothetical protein